MCLPRAVSLAPGRQGAKAFSHLRIPVAKAAMDATRAGAKADAAKAEAPAAATDEARERRRARAYLDLWERHVVHAALHGAAACPAPPPA
jgi:hypothetical protein